MFSLWLRPKLIWFIAILTGCIVALLTNLPLYHGTNESYLEQLAGVTELRETILKNYVDEIDDERLYYGALKGMVEEFDQYGEFIEPRDVEDFINSMEGKFGGLGIYVTKENGILTVVTPIEGTPAFNEGILAGDRILKIDGTSTEGMEITEASRRLRGEEGTQVTVTVLHSGETTPVDITITRALIKIESIKGARILDTAHRIGYIRITQFQDETYSDFVKEATRLQSEGMQSMILDLRFNPGGLFSECVKIADEFLDSGLIVITVKRDGIQNKTEATTGGLLLNIPVVVLINKGSASASEIVTGSLQDNNMALIIGTRSFGKGSVQTIFKIDRDRSRLKLTTARYYTPNGHCIHKSCHCLHESDYCYHKKNEKEYFSGGLRPDVEVNISDKDELELRKYLHKLDTEPKDEEFWTKHSPVINKLDSQLSKAIEYLRDMKLYEKTLAETGSRGM
ncbi:MAG: S41 family peptidase [Planctomycetota bacterium]